jgi:hypothetical protein
MAIYSTFFLCKPNDLLQNFPGWRLPLPTPVRRQLKNPFTGQTSTIETQEPEWPDEEDAFEEDYPAVVIEGDYQDYLEGRLSAAVQACPHWAAKNLTEVELGPLAEALGEQPKFTNPLYGPPSRGALLRELPPGILTKLASLDQLGLEALADSWAATMLTDDYTHSVTGTKLNDGWTRSEAMLVLQPIAALAKRPASDERMYLLIEA